MKGSSIANEVDNEYKRKQMFVGKRIEEYKNRNCSRCKNKNKNICNIVIQVNGKAGCVYYEK